MNGDMIQYAHGGNWPLAVFVELKDFGTPGNPRILALVSPGTKITNTRFSLDPDDYGDTWNKRDGVLNIPKIIFSKSSFKYIVQNILNAFADGQPQQLSWDGKGEVSHKARRSEALKGHINTKGKGWSMDEYPFASTYEGGHGAEVMEVPAEENSKQGNKIKKFKEKNIIRDRDVFDVDTN
jgi:hypothetical protein